MYGYEMVLVVCVLAMRRRLPKIRLPEKMTNVCYAAERMIDIHNHLLHALDDGSPDLETSVAMARLAVADGITHMVCTPHASSAFTFAPEKIEQRLEELRSALRTADIPLTLGRGCDFHISYDNVRDALANPKKYTLNGGEYLLIELPDLNIPPAMDQLLYDLRLAGMTPILTHPERNPALQRDSSRLRSWLEGGLLVQVTANSVTGGMGKTAQKMAHELLSKHWVHFLASDAHNTSTRPPGLTAAKAWVDRRCGSHYAELLTATNPAAAFHSAPLPEQEEMQDLEEEFVDESAQPWWKRLFERLN